MKIALIAKETEVLRKVFEKVARPDTEVGFKPPRNPEGLILSNRRYAYTWLLMTRGIVEGILEAEEEGYDAAIIMCFEDPALREAREVAHIPVIGLSEASMFLACILGLNFAILIPDEVKIKIAVLDNIRRYGLESRVIDNPIRPISMSFNEAYEGDPKVVALRVIEDAKECVKDGAEVIVLGCMHVATKMTIADVAKVTVDGRDVPILDCLSVGIKTAEFIVDLRDKMGVPVPSRAALYWPPKQSTLNRIRSVFGLGT